MRATPSVAPRVRLFGRTLLLALPCLLAVAVYGYCLRLPFFLDDVPHFAIIRDFAWEGTTWINFFWGGNGVYPYYRPFTFTIWKLSQALSGGQSFDPYFLHLFNVFAYALTSVLIGLSARRLLRIVTPNLIYADLLGAALGCAYALYPFSYQAVTLSGALAHIALTFGTALALYAVLLWMDGGARWQLAVALVGVFIALFSHENSIFVPPLLGLLCLVRYGKRTFGVRGWALFVPMAVLLGVYVFKWFTIPRTGGGLSLYGDTAIIAMGHLAQGLVYPFAALLRPWVTGSTALLLGLFVVVALAGLWLAWSRGGATGHAWRWAAYGLVWYVLGIIPSSLLLNIDYVVGSPRLTMFPAIGATLFWGAVLSAVLRPLPARRILVGAAALLLLYTAALTVHFSLLRRHDALRMGDYYHQLYAMIGDQYAMSPSARVLLVNPPDYIAPLAENHTFLSGAEGFVMVADFVDLSRLVWIHTGIEGLTIEGVSYNAIKRYTAEALNTRPPTLESAALAERARQATHIYVTAYVGERFLPRYVGGTAAISAGAVANVRFGQALSLLNAQAIFSGGAVLVTTTWRADAPQAVQPFVHLVCNGQLVGQLDAAVWGETYPFALWSAGEVQTDVRLVALDPAHLATVQNRDCLRALIGTYSQSDGVRLPALDAQGARLVDDVFNLSVQQP
jgi:hypothetical protein